MDTENSENKSEGESVVEAQDKVKADVEIKVESEPEKAVEPEPEKKVNTRRK